MSDVAEVKDAARAVWAAGDYDVIAELIWDVGARIVGRLEITPGEVVLLRSHACAVAAKGQSGDSEDAGDRGRASGVAEGILPQHILGAREPAAATAIRRRGEPGHRVGGGRTASGRLGQLADPVDEPVAGECGDYLVDSGRVEPVEEESGHVNSGAPVDERALGRPHIGDAERGVKRDGIPNHPRLIE